MYLILLHQNFANYDVIPEEVWVANGNLVLRTRSNKQLVVFDGQAYPFHNYFPNYSLYIQLH